jgi:spoIIIJ-associated protein
MGLGGFEIAEEVDGDYLILHLDGDAAGELAGGDGRGIDALQLIANQAAMRSDPDGARVIVDVEGSSEKRETSLSKLASRAAKRAADTGRSIALEPMNGKDRRIVHIALREEGGVATMSKGEGRYRQVVVVPEGAPEFEEAQRAMEAADSGR